jgi:hypothetical protein
MFFSLLTTCVFNFAEDQHLAKILSSNIKLQILEFNYWQYKKISCPFPLSKFIRFLLKWEKIDKYATCMVLVRKD